MLRSSKHINILGFRFTLMALAFIFFIYYAYVFHYLQDQYYKKVASVSFKLIFFHIALFLMMWSFIRSVVTDPGRVPVYWGLFLDDPESKKRRYCLICHVFKPERCHHCSTCVRCVLNMDHHCPWINNCVGFNNRKFFMLMLFYICIISIFCFLTMLQPLIEQALDIYENGYSFFQSSFIVKLLSLICLSVFCPVIGHFFYFHIQLMLSNVTTIEQLEKVKEKLDNGNQKDKVSVLDNIESNQNVYDLGKRKNFYQVFGQNPILWLLPVFGESGRPYGDGVAWNKNAFQKQITLETKDIQVNLKDLGVRYKSDENKQQNQQSEQWNVDQINQNNQSMINQQQNQSFINLQSNKSFVNQQNNGNQSNNPLNITQNNNNNSFFQEYQSSLIINLLNNTQSQTNVGNQVQGNLQNASPKQSIYQIQSRNQVQN
ncbi:hypothetical protein ABPG74_001362 [Tetrahymena malaccensis]